MQINESHFNSIRRNTKDERIVTPKMVSRNNDGKMKLRDKRMIRLNIERRKASDKAVNNTHDISPGIISNFRNNATTPTKVIIFTSIVYLKTRI